MNKRKQLYYEAKYFNWNEDAFKYNLKCEEFNELYDSLDKAKMVSSKTKTVKLPWLKVGDGAWRYDRLGAFESIYLFKDNKLYIYSSNYLDNNKNQNQIANPGMHLSGGENSGRKAIKLVKEMFKEHNGTSVLKAFGYTEEDYKICIPKQFYYSSNPSKETKIIEHASSVDWSSMYPSNMCGSLPDSHTAIKVNGKVAPTADYPFAFYLETGHLAIYNELDTHDWLSNKLCNEVFRAKRTKNDNFVQHPYGTETYTILMKASKYELTSVYTEAYKRRKQSEDMKLIMNASIGYFHTNQYTTTKLAHLAAVCIARSNNKMLNLTSILDKKDIIQVCVDGLIYRGNYKFGSDVKELGVLNQEVLDATVAYKQMNMYIFMKDNQVVKYKHGACNYNLDGTKIDDSNVKDFSAIDNWVKLDSKTRERNNLLGE